MGLAIEEGHPPGAWTRLEAKLARFFTQERARIYSRLMVCVLLIGYLVSIAFGVLYYRAPVDAARAVIGVDFSAFYWAGHALLSGQAAQLYDLAPQAHFLSELVAPVSSNNEVHAFISPPYWALGFVPFAMLPYPLALFVFSCVSYGCWFWVVQRLRKEFSAFSELGSTKRLMLLGLGFFPVPLSFLDGQTSMLLLALLVGFFVQLRSESDFRAGLVLGLLAVKPQIALGPVLMLLVTKRWKVLAGATLSGGLLVGTAQAFIPGALVSFVRLVPQLTHLLRADGYPRWGQTSLMGFGTLLFDPISHALGSVVGYSLMALGMVGAVCIARWFGGAANVGKVTPRAGSVVWDLRWAACLSLGLISMPHLFSYDLALLVLPLTLVLSRVHRPHSDPALDGGPLLVAVWLLCLACWCGPYFASWTQSLLRAFSLPGSALQPVTPAVAWFAYCVARRARQAARLPLEVTKPLAST